MQGVHAYTYGDLEKAQYHLEEAAKKSPRIFWVKLFLGIAYQHLKNFSDAEQAFRDALTLDSQHSRAYAGLLDSLVAQQKWNSAITPGLRAVELCPSLTKAHFQLGVALAHLGAFKRAIEAFQTAQKQAPNWAAPRKWLTHLSQSKKIRHL